MIANQDKIDLIINKINNLDAVIKSFIDNADALKDKYFLEDEIVNCNAKKHVFIKMLEDLGYFGYQSP